MLRQTSFILFTTVSSRGANLVITKQTTLLIKGHNVV